MLREADTEESLLSEAPPRLLLDAAEEPFLSNEPPCEALPREPLPREALDLCDASTEPFLEEPLEVIELRRPSSESTFTVRLLASREATFT